MKWILTLVIFSLVVTPVCAQEVIATWDDPAAELAGWEKAGTTAFTEYHASGGNPGGHVRVYGNLMTGLMNKQPAFTGDYIAQHYNNISVDIMVNLQQLPNFKPHIEIRYSPSFAGWSYELTDFDINTAGTWQHFDVYFDPTWSDADAQANGWTLASGTAKTFQETLGHVWALSVKGRYPQFTSKNLGFDNFKLSNVVPPSAEPVVEEEPEETGSTSEESTPKPVIKTIKPIELKRAPVVPRKIRRK